MTSASETPHSAAAQNAAGSPAPSRRRRRHKPRQKKQRRRGNPLWGKIWLGIIFCLFRALDALLYFRIFEDEDRKHYFGFILGGMVWTTGLLGAIWRRQDWVRYVLAMNLFLVAIGSIAAIPPMFDHSDENYEVIKAIAAYGLVCALIGWLLIGSRDIKKLAG